MMKSMSTLATQAVPILLIEDDPSLRGMLWQFLLDHGYQTAAAATSAEGWRLITSAAPKVILLDLNLPDGSGLDLLRRMASAKCRSRVVVMTAFDVARLRPAEAEHLIAAWLTKPVNPGELLTIIETELGGSATESGGHIC